MTDDGQPDLKYADDWLRDASVKLYELARTHNDQRLADLAATISDVAARGHVISRYSFVPTPAQLNAVAERAARSEVTQCLVRPFDLPEDYIQVTFADGFVCGVAPDGQVSS